MISIGKVVSVGDGVRYFEEAVAERRIDYYAGRGEAPGIWRGPGAARLGLVGAVGRDELVAVLEGRHPATGEELGRHHARSKNVAFDVTFSLPKSVTLLYALGDDPTRGHVLDALDAGATAAHEYLQRHAVWGRVYNRDTHTVERVRADLTTASFVHRTARPVTRPDGRTTVDPQLHCHLLVASFVHRANGTWGQLDSEPLYAHAAAASAVGQAATRDALVRTLGVRVRTNANATFELEGFAPEQLAEFSQRHAQVLAAATAAGATSMYGVKLAVLDSRQSKREVEPGADLFAQWEVRAASVGLTRDRVGELLGREQVRELRWFDVDTVGELLGRGQRGLTQHTSVFTRRDLVRCLASHAPLGMRPDGIETLADAILARPDLAVPMQPRRGPEQSPSEAMRRWVERGMELHYSTPEVVVMERRMLESARARVGEGTAVVDATSVNTVLDGVTTRLTRGQREMVDAACTSPDGVLVIEGAAGAGKTTAARCIDAVFAATNTPVLGCAPSGRAVRGLEMEAGIPSLTVSSLLHRLRGGERLPIGSVVLADECSMIGPDLAELVLLAHRDRVKLLLVGDSQQLQPIDGGAVFRSLGNALGRVRLTEVIRQQEVWDREVLTAFREGEVAPLVQRYLEEGRVHECPSASARVGTMAADWVAATKDGHDCLGVARERSSVAALNAVTREAAIRAGLVDVWGVTRTCVDHVGGRRLPLGELDFAVGDRVLVVGRNDRRLGLVKGMRGSVVATRDDGGLLVEPSDARGCLVTVPASYDGIAHGYAMTAHRAQGATVDIALVHGSDAADRQWQYVALSRHRLRCTYYDVTPAPRDADGVHHAQAAGDEPIEDRLLRAMSREGVKASTLDYPDAYEREGASRFAATGPDAGPSGPATESQLSVLRDRGVLHELPPAPTWVHASVRIDQCEGRPAGETARRLLLETGVGEDEAHGVVVRARLDLDTCDAAPLRQTKCRDATSPANGAGTATDARSTEADRDRERRWREQLERDREQRRQQERDRGPSMGVW